MREFTTGAGLVEAINTIKGSPRGWNGQPGRELLAYAAYRLAKVSAHYQTDRVDAATAAWTFWESHPQAVANADDAWAVTIWNVRRALSAEATAQAKLTSLQGLDRQGIDDLVGFADDGLELLSTFVSPEEEPEAVGPPTFRTPALAAVQSLLEASGYAPAHASEIIEAIASCAAESSHAGGSKTRKRKGTGVAVTLGLTPSRLTALAAVQRLRKDTALAAALGIPAGRLTAIAAILFGNERGDEGALTIMHGDGSTELPQTKQVKNAIARFARAA